MTDSENDSCYSSSHQDRFDYSYRNCIVTRNGNSSSSNMTDAASNTTLTVYNESVLTCDDLKTIKLSPDELFAFMLDMVVKMDKFLKEPDNVFNKEWLINQTNIFKTALISHADIFQVYGVSFRNGGYFLDTLDLETNESQTENRQETIEHGGKYEQVDESEQCTESCNEQIKKQSQKNNNQKGKYKKKLKNSKDQDQSRRRSERIHDQKGRIIMCDDMRMTYIPIKLPKGTSTPKPKSKSSVKKLESERKKLNNIRNKKPTKLNKENLSDQVKNVKHKLTQQEDQSSVQTAEASTSKEDSRKNKGHSTKKGKVSSKMSPLKKVNKQSNQRKRRAKSLDNQQNKKAKTNEVQNLTVPTSQNLILNKSRTSRKLYSPETWLELLKGGE